VSTTPRRASKGQSEAAPVGRQHVELHAQALQSKTSSEEPEHSAVQACNPQCMSALVHEPDPQLRSQVLLPQSITALAQAFEPEHVISHGQSSGQLKLAPEQALAPLHTIWHTPLWHWSHSPGHGPMPPGTLPHPPPVVSVVIVACVAPDVVLVSSVVVVSSSSVVVASGPLVDVASVASPIDVVSSTDRVVAPSVDPFVPESVVEPPSVPDDEAVIVVVTFDVEVSPVVAVPPSPSSSIDPSSAAPVSLVEPPAQPPTLSTHAQVNPHRMTDRPDEQSSDQYL
jgi:hypothetical protein